jgi:hypothetical protein
VSRCEDLNTGRGPTRILRLLAAPVVGLAVGGAAPAAALPAATEGPEFAISSSVRSLPDCATPAQLYPGVERCLLYAVTNPSSTSITVTSIVIADVQAPEGCDRTNLDLSGSAFTGALTVPAGATAVSPPLRIVLEESGSNQDACQGATFSFAYSGVATADIGASPPPAASPPGRGTAGEAAGDPPLIPVTGTNARLPLVLGALAVAAGLVARWVGRRPGRRAGADPR